MFKKYDVFFMKMYPLFEVISQLKFKKIFAIDIIHRLKERSLNLYFEYSGYIGFSDNIYYEDDLSENIVETKFYEGFISVDVNLNRINRFYEILKTEGIEEVGFEKGILDGRLAFFINTNIDNLPVMYGNVFGKLINNVEIVNLKISYKKIYISEEDFNNLLKERINCNNDNINEPKKEDQSNNHFEKLISEEVVNIEDIKEISERDGFRYPSEDYLKEFTKLNEKYGIEIPEKIFIALELYLKIYLDEQYESQSKNTKLSHNVMFERCIQTFHSRYRLNGTVIGELKRFTNPKPQDKIKIE